MMSENGNKGIDISALLGSCPIPISDYKEITLGHGSGGKLTHQLIRKMLLPQFQNEWLEPLHDGAILSFGDIRLAFSTDSFVVNPIFFPGGNIGELAVNGTVNDIAMCGAKPQYLSAGFILEEGFSMDDFWQIIQSMQQAAQRAGVMLVTGDTKVVNRGKGDKIYISTSGIGVIEPGVNIHPSNIKEGDKIIISGFIAEHGIAVMSVREGLEFETQILSDTAALNDLVSTMLTVSKDIHLLRDPTRGGVTGVLTEIAEQSGLGVFIEETKIPLSEEVKGACEILGLDPMHVAMRGNSSSFCQRIFVMECFRQCVIILWEKNPRYRRSSCRPSWHGNNENCNWRYACGRYAFR
jgi:hydrogenase expression/formation protein HypE